MLIDPCTVPVIHATSPSTTIRNAMTQHSKILTTTLICYMTSAVAFAFFHVISSTQTPNSSLRFFVKSKYVLPVFGVVNVLTSRRKHPFYLDGRVVFLFFSQIVHGVLFLLRNVLLGRSVIGWKPRNPVSPAISPIVELNSHFAEIGPGFDLQATCSRRHRADIWGILFLSSTRAVCCGAGDGLAYPLQDSNRLPLAKTFRGSFLKGLYTGPVFHSVPDYLEGAVLGHHDSWVLGGLRNPV